jgi:single-strand DNA-binding protein
VTVLDNTVVVVGNLAADPEYRRLDNEVEVANFRVGSTKRRFDRESGTWVDGQTSWWRVSCWRGLAANTAASLRKGDRVVVVGRVRTSLWEKDGRTGTSLEIDADAVGHDLAYGTSRFERVVRSEKLPLPTVHDPETGLHVDANGEVVEDADGYDEVQEPVTV